MYAREEGTGFAPTKQCLTSSFIQQPGRKHQQLPGRQQRHVISFFFTNQLYRIVLHIPEFSFYHQNGHGYWNERCQQHTWGDRHQAGSISYSAAVSVATGRTADQRFGAWIAGRVRVLLEQQLRLLSRNKFSVRQTIPSSSFADVYTVNVSEKKLQENSTELTIYPLRKSIIILYYFEAILLY